MQTPTFSFYVKAIHVRAEECGCRKMLTIIPVRATHFVGERVLWVDPLGIDAEIPFSSMETD